MGEQKINLTGKGGNMSSIEVGYLFKGTKGINYNERWNTGWESMPNFVGGIGVKHDYFNATDKMIKYITFTYVAYNSVNDIIVCTTTGITEASVRITGPFSPYSSYFVANDVLWYNPTVDSVKIKSIDVEYSDGTNETIAGEDVVSMSNKESVYYQKIGKAKEEQLEKDRIARKKKKIICVLLAIILSWYSPN